MSATCEVCGIFLKAPSKNGGRPRRYCSLRCKGKARRRRDRDEDRASHAQAASVEPESGPALCHLCAQGPATVGTPHPVLCAGCAHP